MVERIRRTRAPQAATPLKSEEEVAAEIRKEYGPDLKYAVYPGPVTSKTDGDQHFIPSEMLIMLYKVDPRECIVIRRNDDPTRYLAAQEIAKEFNLIPLVPQYNGDYSIPTGV